MKTTTVTVIFLAALDAVAQSAAPAGLWQTVNERGEREALVRIVEVAGELRGNVVEVYSPPAPSAQPLCEACSGALRNQPIVGMEILRGLRWDGERYSGGEILDPDEGRAYRCTLRLLQGGERLEVRGYVGISLFGRSQVWLRVR
jgi:uncharacterized protein (DUF2147 family)